MATDNLTAVLYGINDIRLENTPIEQPGDGDVLIQMSCVGICGSDVHYLVHGRCCDFIVREPMIIGHEAAGTVAKVGKNVTHLKVGDRVAIEPGTPCRVCNFCKTGQYNLCPDMLFCATPPVHGNLRRFYKHAADFCFKLPDNVTLEEGALLEPLAVGVHACKRANIGIGQKVLILGAGPIGLVNLMVAKAMGASKVVITDLVESRLTLAKKIGADETMLIKPGVSEEENIKKLLNIIGDYPDKTIEVSGAEPSMRLAVLITKSGGIAVLVGMGKPEISLPIMNALTREVDIRGVFRYCNDYADALDLVASGKINNLRELITHNFTINETVKAFETAKTPSCGAVKVMIHVK